MENVILFGNTKAVIMAYYQLAADPNYEVVGFTVDKKYITGNQIFELPVVPFEQVETIFTPENIKMLIPIGYSVMNTLRAQKYFQAKEKGYSFITFIHPTAIIYPEVSIGENCLIGSNTVIQPAAKIGDNVIIRENCHIGHDNDIHDHCFISGHANLSGNVTIKQFCFLGAGSIFKTGIIIEKSTLIGAGVTMLQNSKENEVYMARSAQKLPFSSNQIKI